jgi:hypothetical protein
MATTSTQTSFDRIVNADAQAQGIDGGLNVKIDASKLPAPATTRADNANFAQLGTVQQLPPFQSTLPQGFQHVYNVAAKDTASPSLQGDVMVHGELPDPAGPFTTPVWAHANGTVPNRTQPVLPFSLRTRTFASALQRSQQDMAQWPLLMARQELATTGATRRFAAGYYDGTSFNLSFGNVDGLTDTGETLTLALTAQWVDMIGLQGTGNLAIVALNAGTLTRYIYDFYGNVVTTATVLTTACLAVTAAGTGTTSSPPMTLFHHNQVTYVGYAAQLSTVQSGITSYGIYVRPLLTNATSYFLSGMGPAQAGAPLQGLAISSPTTHQAPGAANYLAVAYDGRLYVVTNPLGGGTYAVSSPLSLQNQATSGVSAGSQGYNNGVTTLVAMAANDGQQAATPTAQLAIAVYRHLSEQVTPQGPNSSGVAYQYVAVDAASFAGGTLTLVASTAFRTPAGAAIAAHAFAACPPEANFAGASAAVQGYCVVRQGAWQPYQGYGGGTGIGQYWIYDQPTYFLIDHRARIVARWAEGQAPIGGTTDLAACAQIYGTVTNYARFPMCTGLGRALVSDTSGTANDVSVLDVILPTWVMTQQDRPASYTLKLGSSTAQIGTTILDYYVAMPLAAHLSLSASASQPPTASGQGYTVVSGPLTCVHDGRAVVEAGFHSQTHNLMVAAYAQGDSGASSTALGPAGFYFYVATWEWTDAQGRLHRSNPSRPMWCYVSSSFYGAKVTVPSPLSVRGAVGTSVICRLYRTVSDSTNKNLYLVASQAVPCFTPSPSSASALYGTTLSDASLVQTSALPSGASAVSVLEGQSGIYTGISAIYSGAVYASMPPPPFLWQTASKGRAFGLAMVQGEPRLYYTGTIQSGVTYEWNALNYTPVPADLGDCRSIDGIDDKIIVIGARSVGFMSGDGPPGYNSVGQPSPGDGFGPIYPLPGALGCLGSGAPCRTPDGVVFQGTSGFQIVSRSLTVEPAGAQVDPITGRQVGNPGVLYARGQLMSSLQAVVWSNPTGPALVLNYLSKKWSTWPLLANGASIAQRGDGTVVVAMQPIVGARYLPRASSTTLGADLGVLGTTYAPIYRGLAQNPGLVLETPWIQPSGESSGESAIFDVAVTGAYRGPHVLQIEQCYNYSNTYQPTVNQFTVSAAPQSYQFRVRPIGGTRFWAVRYRLSLLPLPGKTLADGYNLAALGDLVVFAGNKQGTTRLLAGQSG